MALARVQAAPRTVRSSQAAVAITFSAPPAIGNGLVVPFLTNAGNTASLLLSCSDNFGNGYFRAADQASPNNDARAAVFVCPKVAATGVPFTITLEAEGSTWWVAMALEISGVGAGLGLDRSIGQGGSSLAPATG